MKWRRDSLRRRLSAEQMSGCSLRAQLAEEGRLRAVPSKELAELGSLSSRYLD